MVQKRWCGEQIDVYANEISRLAGLAGFTGDALSKSQWYAPKNGEVKVWCDASAIALGVILEANGSCIEDAAWLRKKDDYEHINVAELNAVLKGVNLALGWGYRSFELFTDSATVFNWISNSMSEEKRVKTKGAAEIMIKRRLGILKNIVREFEIYFRVRLIATDKNKADMLTRVPKKWLTTNNTDEQNFCAGVLNLKEVHDAHHFGVDRTLFLARQLDPSISRAAVQRVVRQCDRCQMINPAPVRHNGGEINASENWQRVAIDVTHYRHQPYLSIIDCGPSRFALWKELRMETANHIAQILNDIFLERGPVSELLMDNATVFRSVLIEDISNKWNIKRLFRAAYRPSGNGIVERNHRTIKTTAEKSNIPPSEAVFWYNMTPRLSQNEESVPHRALFKYSWRHPSVCPVEENEEAASVEIGEEVWVKPADGRCTTP
ncbi:uncharacterized protein LOC123519337 [Portunus trituberculatus]|uniref:uncharacterized protein LOC123519337 n=1 Tax=Portunus trituberculatus TaxID=210409 RepID=UPI001E1CEA2A|nr:uncharacterized protein LOC123519337 [Portunus trituberculatus]